MKAVFILMAIGALLSLVSLLAIRCHRDPYRITWRDWARIQAGSHLLTYQENRWVIVPLERATDKDAEEHAFHWSQGSGQKATIEANMQDGVWDAHEEQSYIDSRLQRHKALLTGAPLPGEDDGSEGAYAELEEAYEEFPWRTGERMGFRPGHRRVLGRDEQIDE